LRDHVGTLVVVDRAPADGQLQWDVAAPAAAPVRAALAGADVVVCALPDDALRCAVATTLPVLDRPCLMVDTASVKSFLVPLWASAPSHVALLSINPMFAPHLDPRGRPVLAIQPRPSSAG